MLWFSTALAGFQLFTSVFIHDTPAWLRSQGRTEEAKKVSQKLWNRDNTLAGSPADEEEREEGDEQDALIGSPAAASRIAPLTISELLKSADLRRAVLIVALSQLTQQGSGINAGLFLIIPRTQALADKISSLVMFYSTDILSKALPDSAAYVSLLIAIFNCVMTFPPVFLIEVSASILPPI